MRALYLIVLIGFLSLATPQVFALDITAADDTRISELPPLELEARMKQLAASKRWRNLLHYRRAVPFSWSSGWSPASQVDGQGFFFASDGARNLESELRETVRAFFSDRKVGFRSQHPQCAFPERYRFLKSQLKLLSQDRPCPELDVFLMGFQAKKVSLVFSSAYPNNPGSMFGHTFLHFISGRRPEILDGTISYAAYVGPDSGIIYMVKGVFGGYPGLFAMSPYYAKINEYNNSESRDIIEYVLSLDENDVQSLLRHLWELETNSRTDYYFFDENCASVILDAIEAVRPDIEFRRSPFFLTPGESVRYVTEIPGLVSEVRFRPSLFRKFSLAARRLDPTDAEGLELVLSGKAEAAEIARPTTLDAANLYFQYLKQKQKGLLTAEQNSRANDFLIRRSDIDGSSVPIAVSQSEAAQLRPERAHRPSRLTLAGGDLRGHRYSELGFRFSLHDLLDRDEGYVPFSHIEILSGAFRLYADDQKFLLDRLTVVSTTSLFAISQVERRKSWRFNLEFRRPKDYGCLDCPVLHADGGVGGTFALSQEKWLGFIFATLEGDAGLGSVSGLRRGYRLSPALSFGTIANPFAPYKALLTADVVWDAFQYQRPLFTTRLQARQALAIGKDWRLHFDVSWSLPWRADAPDVRESSLALSHYF